MGTYNWSNLSVVLAGGFDLRPYTLSLAPKYTAGVDEVTPAGATAETKKGTGVITSALSHELLYDDNAAASNDFLHSVTIGKLGVVVPLCYGMEGNVAGQRFVGHSAVLASSDDRTMAKDQLHRIGIEYSSSGAYGAEDGQIIIAAGTTATAGATSAVVDSGIVTSAGTFFVAATAVTLGSYTSWTCKLQDSADNNTFADVSGAIATITLAGGQAIAAAAVRRYWRVIYALVGAGSNPSLTFFAGATRH
jgi:hypothetical protein